MILGPAGGSPRSESHLRTLSPMTLSGACRRAQAEFDQIDGIVSSAVGYTGGSSAAPTYNSVCRGDGHTEAIKLEFDPAVISYEEVMRKVLAQAYGGGGKSQCE